MGPREAPPLPPIVCDGFLNRRRGQTIDLINLSILLSTF